MLAAVPTSLISGGLKTVIVAAVSMGLHGFHSAGIKLPGMWSLAL